MDRSAPKPKRVPKSRAGKLLINLLVTAVVGFVYFYVTLPAINLQASEFYTFVGVLCVVYVLCALVTSGMNVLTGGGTRRVPAVLLVHAVGLAVAVLIQAWASQWMDMVSIYICPFGAMLAGVMFFYVMRKQTALEAVSLGAKSPVGGWFMPFGRYVYVPLCVIALVAGAILGGIG